MNFEHISCLCGSRHYGSALFDGEKAARRMMVLSAAVLYADKIKEPCRLPVCRLFYRCELVVDTLFVVDIASSLVTAWLYDTFRNDIVLFSLNTGKGFCDVIRHPRVMSLAMSSPWVVRIYVFVLGCHRC